MEAIKSPEKIKLQFEYSLKSEEGVVKGTLDDTDWLIEYGYDEWLSLPGDMTLKEALTDPASVMGKLKDEYNESEYKEVEQTVIKRWTDFSSGLAGYFDNIGFKPEKAYIIQLTKYGVGGSYHLPNKVVVNFYSRYGIGVSKTIMHEIVHLSIQNLIDKYNIEHWNKERLVDLILLKIIPKHATMQPIKEVVSAVDRAFEYYPDIEKVIKNIGSEQ